eukprot:TRINITY_DN5699_c0_g1_i2.p1 TRINITY_DN5699_c0_g1~~TRINITY_DN5699_c0_g1_i2.p1  ORF type:complete len:305 (-),score=91.77 TRINITY_DN5699_c0_g1_i2:74-988(-)
MNLKGVRISQLLRLLDEEPISSSPVPTKQRSQLKRYTEDGTPLEDSGDDVDGYGEETGDKIHQIDESDEYEGKSSSNNNNSSNDNINNNITSSPTHQYITPSSPPKHDNEESIYNTDDMAPRRGTVSLPYTNLIPIKNVQVDGVQLIERDSISSAQLESLKILASSKDVFKFGNDIKVDLLDTLQVGTGKTERTFFQVKLTTNMRQFSHITFDKIVVLRAYSHFEDLYKKVQSNCTYEIPKFPKKDFFGRFSPETIKNRIGYFQMLMNHITKVASLYTLPCFVDFFDDSKTLNQQDLRQLNIAQ